MLKKVVYVFCGPSDVFWQSTKESAGIGNEEEYWLGQLLVCMRE